MIYVIFPEFRAKDAKRPEELEFSHHGFPLLQAFLLL